MPRTSPRRGRRSLCLLLGSLVAVGLAAEARALADSTVRGNLNGREHVFVVPEGWTSASEPNGMTLKPPTGDLVVYVTVEAYTPGKGSLKAQSADKARSLADAIVKKYGHLSRDDGTPRRLAGHDGVLYVLRSHGPGYPGRMWLMVAVSEDTSFAFSAFGAAAELERNARLIDRILDGVQPVQGAAGSSGSSGAAAGFAPRKDEPSPAPIPPAGSPLVDDPLLGVNVDAIPDFGVWTYPDQYLLEKRFGPGKRILVSIWQAGTTFTGDGVQYAQQAVQPTDSWEWGRFARRTALVVKVGAQGDADVRDVHVLRRGKPIALRFWAYGMRWGDARAEETQKQVERALRIFDPPVLDFGRGKTAVRVGGGVVVADLPRAWRLAAYGPGARADFDGPKGVRVRVAVSAPDPKGPAVSCDNDHSQPPARDVHLLGRKAKRFECPFDLQGQVAYVIPAGVHEVWLFLTDERTRAASGPVTEFPKFLRLP